MTKKTETTETKKAGKKPDLYIFDGEGQNRKIVGSVYFHGKGKGLNVLMNGKRYSAFAPKAKPEATGAGA